MNDIVLIITILGSIFTGILFLLKIALATQAKVIDFTTEIKSVKSDVADLKVDIYELKKLSYQNKEDIIEMKAKS